MHAPQASEPPLHDPVAPPIPPELPVTPDPPDIPPTPFPDPSPEGAQGVTHRTS